MDNAISFKANMATDTFDFIIVGGRYPSIIIFGKLTQEHPVRRHGRLRISLETLKSVEELSGGLA